MDHQEISWGTLVALLLSCGVMDGAIYGIFMGIYGYWWKSTGICGYFMIPKHVYVTYGYIDLWVYVWYCLIIFAFYVQWLESQRCVYFVCCVLERSMKNHHRLPKGSTWDHRIRAEHRSCTVVFHSLWAFVDLPNLHSTCITFSLEWTYSTSNLPLAYIYIMFNLHSTYMQATFNLHST